MGWGLEILEMVLEVLEMILVFLVVVLVCGLVVSLVCRVRFTPRSEKVDPVRYQVPAFCYVKPTRDHLQKVQFDLPDRSRGVPELPRANLGPKNPPKRIMWIYFLRAGGNMPSTLQYWLTPQDLQTALKGSKGALRGSKDPPDNHQKA